MFHPIHLGTAQRGFAVWSLLNPVEPITHNRNRMDCRNISFRLYKAFKVLAENYLLLLAPPSNTFEAIENMSWVVFSLNSQELGIMRTKIRLLPVRL